MKGYRWIVLLALGFVLSGCTGAQASSAAVVKAEAGFISAETLNERMEAGEELQLLDVREASELEEIPLLPGSLHIPLDELKDRKGELDATREVIIVCRSGRRAKLAANDLLEAGFTRLLVLDGGMLSWQKTIQPQAAP